MAKELQSSQTNQTQELLKGLGITNPELKHQAHGKTVAQMKEHQSQQISGTAPKITANIDPSFEIPEAEKHMIHANITKSTYNTDTGALISKIGAVRGFDVADFLRMVKEHAFIGKDVKVIHDPRPEAEKSAQKIKMPAAPDAEVNVEAMSEQMLRAEYKFLFGDDSDILDGPAELRILIKEKRAFNLAEKAGK